MDRHRDSGAAGLLRDAVAGDRVMLTGLVKKPELNGVRGTVEPKARWKGDRVAVRCLLPPPRTRTLTRT
jgi:hypothetical protein